MPGPDHVGGQPLPQWPDRLRHRGDWASHRMEHELSALFDVATARDWPPSGELGPVCLPGGARALRPVCSQGDGLPQ